MHVKYMLLILAIALYFHHSFELDKKYATHRRVFLVVNRTFD